MVSAILFSDLDDPDSHEIQWFTLTADGPVNPVEREAEVRLDAAKSKAAKAARTVTR